MGNVRLILSRAEGSAQDTAQLANRTQGIIVTLLFRQQK